MSRLTRPKTSATVMAGMFLVHLLTPTVAPRPAQARMDPLNMIMRQLHKPNMLILLDTSGSLTGVPGGTFDNSDEVGVDCNDGLMCRGGLSVGICARPAKPAPPTATAARHLQLGTGRLQQRQRLPVDRRPVRHRAHLLLRQRLPAPDQRQLRRHRLELQREQEVHDAAALQAHRHRLRRRRRLRSRHLRRQQHHLRHLGGVPLRHLGRRVRPPPHAQRAAAGTTPTAPCGPRSATTTRRRPAPSSTTVRASARRRRPRAPRTPTARACAATPATSRPVLHHAHQQLHVAQAYLHDPLHRQPAARTGTPASPRPTPAPGSPSTAA